MTKGYWIGRFDVSDVEQYKKYIAANAMPFAKFGAHFLVRAGKFEVAEGAARNRNVVIEFPSYEAALNCYRSPEYQEAKSLRDAVSLGDLIIIDGYDAP